MLDTSVHGDSTVSLPEPSAPRPSEPARWPILAAAAAGLAALAALAALQRLDPLAALLAGAFVAVATGLILFVADRSAEARLAALVRASQERTQEAPPYPVLMDALPDPILVVSAGEPADLTSRRYIYANAAARTLLRINRGEGLLVGATRDPGVLAAAEEALYGGEDAQALHETGGVQARTFSVHARSLGIGPNGRRLAILVFRDETEFHRLERTRVDFLANASHELRTPLASLTGFIETLRGHARDDAAARERFLGIMQAQAERMRRLIDDLLALSRIELNEHVAPADEVDLAAAVMDVMDAAAPLARERGVALQPSLPAGSVRVIGDRLQIVQVIHNLVENALKYSPQGGAVRVTVEAGLYAEQAAAGGRPERPRMALLTPDHPRGLHAAVRVSDDGAGIERANLSRLTERFYRVEGQKSGERQGTGLGLAIVKHIANRHRGGLAVESAPGQGTTFTVWFPQVAVEAALEPAPVAKVS
jgi:two-component system phosphate regulon sensor histidine kinase PhoR